MLEYSVFLSLITLSVCSAGILRKEAVDVLLGEDAVLSCELPGAVGVKQVIWQQQHRAEEPLRSMVTFTEGSTPQVDDAFVGKVNVTVASVDTTAIVIQNVTFADEACYVCTFSVYPSGTERERTCLTVQGLTEITLLQTKPKEKEAVVSCSATGKPAPVISWRIGEEKLSSEPESETVKNGDGTITARSNLTLPQSQLHRQSVRCVATSGSIEKSEVLTVEKHTDTERPGTSRHYVLSAVIIIIVCAVAACCVAVLFHQRRKRYQMHLIEIP